jgi:hypothetical protein
MARVRHVCKRCGIANSDKPHGLCAACFRDWSDARDVVLRGRAVPDDVEGKLKIQAATAGWQLFMADSDLRWRALGKPFILEAAAENAGQIVLAAAKLLHRKA